MAGKMFIGNKAVTPVIIKGGEGGDKYGIPSELFLGSVDEEGRLLNINRSINRDVVITGFKEVYGEECLESLFQFLDLNGHSITFKDLKKITGDWSFVYGIANTTNIVNVSFENLEEITGAQSCFYLFSDSEVEKVYLNKLKKIDGPYSCASMFYFCENLKEVNFDSLSSVIGEYCCNDMFYGCEGIRDIYFPSLTTSSFGTKKTQFTYMLYGCNVTVHFPSNLESTISQLDFYPTFGGNPSQITLSFDLPPTE